MPANSTCKARSIMILHFIFSVAWTLLGIQTLMVSIDYLDNDKYEIMDTDITQEVYNWPVISLNYFSLDSEQTTNILAVIYGCIILISGIVAVLLTCWTRIFALRHFHLAVLIISFIYFLVMLIYGYAKDYRSEAQDTGLVTTILTFVHIIVSKMFYHLHWPLHRGANLKNENLDHNGYERNYY